MPRCRDAKDPDLYRLGTERGTVWSNSSPCSKSWGGQNSPSYAETAEWALAELRASGGLFVNESDQQSSMLIGSDVDFMSMQGLPVFHDWVIANLAAGRSLSLNAR